MDNFRFVCLLALWSLAGCEFGEYPAAADSGSGAVPLPQVDEILVLTEDNFQSQVLGSDELVLVDFWAPWCGPCLQMEPTIEAISQRYAGALVIGKVNVDEQPRLAQQYQIDAIPALLLFRQGQLVEELIGMQEENEIADVLQRYLRHR